MDTTPYHEHVARIEAALAPYSQKSLDTNSPNFLNGTPVLQYFQDRWKTGIGQLKLANRTPLQLERDRILYSSSLRKQTEKYHVLYSGPRRIIRNYTTHTMRMAHVTRAICNALRLNSDFAEAIALGSKVGAAPFIHRTKDVAHEWLQERLTEIDSEHRPKANQLSKSPQLPLFGPPGAGKPKWLSTLQSRDVIDRAVRYIPSAAGDDVDALYQSGAESYWLLCTQPYLRESTRGFYHPETMFGIWRHSRSIRPKIDSFFHECNFDDQSVHKITWEHSTFEGLVVQFADDMTWIIENLNDANDAGLLEGSGASIFSQLRNSLGDAAMELTQPLLDSDPGGLYTYFISDFVRSSQGVFASAGAEVREGLRNGDKGAIIGPSPEAAEQLEHMKSFLDENVFCTSRIRNRNRMLESVSRVSLDLLYDKKESTLWTLIEDRAALESWSNDKRTKSKEMLSDDVHRAQLAIDVFVGLGDQEVFELVGIQAF